MYMYIRSFIYSLAPQVFTSLDPVEARHWTCTETDDLPCQAVLTGPSPVGPAFCKLGPGRTEWTQPGDSIISEFDLTCDSAWKVGLINSFYFVGMAVGGTIENWPPQ